MAPPAPLSRWLVWSVVLLGLGAALYQGILEARSQRFVARGEAAPPFHMTTWGGGALNLDQLKGKVVLLDFWATWCPPCVAELPSLVKLAREFEPKGVVLVAANRDDPENARAAVGRLIDESVPGLGPFVTFADDGVAMRYRADTLPTLYVIDRQGRVVHASTGYTAEPILRSRLERVLAGD